MADKTGIQWTDATWNPTTGCTHVSAGCDHCYAETLSLRLQAMGSPKYAGGFNVALHPQTLDQPRRWQRPRRIFVNSMSDLFHAHVPAWYVDRVWDVMLDCPRHTFQILTKRPERLARYTMARADLTAFPPAHIWVGTSVEDARVMQRATVLAHADAAVRFLSCEPLIGPLSDLPLDGIHWVIVGGESGPHHRPLDLDWVRDIRDQCLARGVAFFFKQVGGPTPKSGGRLLDGRTWDEFPQPAR
jgi:protein gp37